MKVKQQRTFEDALAEVDTITDRLGMPIDPKIKNLVAALHMFGVQTTMSCEGHVDRGHPYPWILVKKEDIFLVLKLVGWNNRPSETQIDNWAILPSVAGHVELVPWNIHHPLQELQQSAEDFAERLKDYASLDDVKL